MKGCQDLIAYFFMCARVCAHCSASSMTAARHSVSHCAYFLGLGNITAFESWYKCVCRAELAVARAPYMHARDHIARAHVRHGLDSGFSLPSRDEIKAACVSEPTFCIGCARSLAAPDNGHVLLLEVRTRVARAQRIGVGFCDLCALTGGGWAGRAAEDAG